MGDLPARPFDEWTLAEVLEATRGEPVDVMPGGRLVPGPRRRLVGAMRAAGATTVAELDPLVRDRHRFALTMMRGRPGWDG